MSSFRDDMVRITPAMRAEQRRIAKEARALEDAAHRQWHREQLDALERHDDTSPDLKARSKSLPEASASFVIAEDVRRFGKRSGNTGPIVRARQIGWDCVALSANWEEASLSLERAFTADPKFNEWICAGVDQAMHRLLRNEDDVWMCR